MPHEPFDLVALARQEMTDEGFQPDFPVDAQQQLAAITLQPDHSLRDLTGLLWSSIDNDDSRDLDQIEWAERVATSACSGLQSTTTIPATWTRSSGPSAWPPESACWWAWPMSIRPWLRRRRSTVTPLANPPRFTPASTPTPCCPSGSPRT